MEGEGMQVREELWVGDRGGAMKLDANCQLSFNADYVCILQQNKEGVTEVEGVCEWGEREKGEGKQLNSKSAYTVVNEEGRDR